MRNLIVLVTDSNYIEHTKYLIGALRGIGEWHGDILIVGNGLRKDEIKEFEEKKLMVMPLSRQNHNWVKVNVFNVYIKTLWDRVLYLDQDMMVYGAVEELFRQDGSFLSDADSKPVGEEFNKDEDPILYAEMEKQYNLKAPAFCAGIFRFDTSIIDTYILSELDTLKSRYYSINLVNGIKGEAEQPILNLYFCNRWKQFEKECFIGIKDKRPGVVLCHTTSWLAPWQKETVFSNEFLPYYKKWRYHFEEL